jgi:hypothetical protein
MTSLFDVDYADDQERNAAGRRATAAALARTKQRFGAFLSGGDLPSRFDLIESDFKQVVADVVAEYGGDADQVEAAVTTVLAAGGFCDDCRKWKTGPRAGCQCHEEGDGDNDADDGGSGEDDGGVTAGSKHWIQDAVKKPGQLHKDLGVPEGEKIPEGKLDEAEHSKNKKVRERAQFAENMKGLHHGAAGFCPGCGSKAQLLGKMGNRDMYQCSGCGSKFAEFDTDPSRGQLGVMPEQTTQAPPSGGAPTWDTSQSVGPPGFSPAMAHWRIVGEALETEKLPKVPFGGDTLDGPSPKMDHKTWKPNATNPDGNLKPIDTEGKGSPHPTEHQDIAHSTDHTRDPFEQTRGGDGVTKTEDLPSNKDDAGFNTKKNITQYPTRTFGDKGQQDKAWGDAAFPKDSAIGDVFPDAPGGHCKGCGRPLNLAEQSSRTGLCAHCGGGQQNALADRLAPQQPQIPTYQASGDPDKNPIRESLRAQHGVLPQDELDAAISSFRS